MWRWQAVAAKALWSAEESGWEYGPEFLVGRVELAFPGFLESYDRRPSHCSVLHPHDATEYLVVLQECPISLFSTLPTRCPTASLDSLAVEDESLRRGGLLADRLLDWCGCSSWEVRLPNFLDCAERVEKSMRRADAAAERTVRSAVLAGGQSGRRRVQWAD